MHNFCSQNNVLSNSQFNFRPGFSTESALISTTHLWHQTLDSSSSICAVFFDLSKAFDSIPHSPLLDSLSSLRLPLILLHWFLSYLSNRSQQVVVNGVISDSTFVTSGVPQGSILGPLLFILYINDISKLTLSSSTKLILYADDILLSAHFSSSSDFTAIQIDIHTINDWIQSHLLKINAQKTKYMLISMKSQSFYPLYLLSFPELFYH